MNNVLFFPTMRCNLKCSYCHFKVENCEGGYEWEGYGKNHRIEKEIGVEDIMNFLYPLRPYHVEFSGGEPTLWKGFKEFTKKIHAGCTWAVTSNTLGNVDGIDFQNCKSWSASYHGVNEEKFFENLLKIKKDFQFISVNFVIEKDKIFSNIKKVFRYAAEGFRPNLLRELNPGVDWRGSEEWQLLADMKKCGLHVVEDDIPPSFDFEKGYTCEGGQKYFAVMPDGKVYRCYSDAMRGEPIGDTKYFESQSGLYSCYKECLGCAMDHKARKEKLPGVGVLEALK